MKKILSSLIMFSTLSSISMGATYMTSAKGNGINVRTSPTTKSGSLKSKVIGKVNSEDVIYTIGNKNKGWYHVRLSKYQANGKKFGYIHESRFQD